MEESRLTRSYLESLSTDELVKLADGFGIDIPAGQERIFIIEELLDSTTGDEFAPEDEPGNRPDFMEAAALPKQYNISYIEVLIRDPLWAFVFWEIKGYDRDLYEKAPDFEGYCLRIVPLTEDKSRGQEGKLLPLRSGQLGPQENSFVVPVGVNDTAWYLGFPPEEGCYKVELCALRREMEQNVLTVSRPFKMPKLQTRNSWPHVSGTHEPWEMPYYTQKTQGVSQNPLVCLSGTGEFALLRSADRRSRFKGEQRS